MLTLTPFEPMLFGSSAPLAARAFPLREKKRPKRKSDGLNSLIFLKAQGRKGKPKGRKGKSKPLKRKEKEGENFPKAARLSVRCA